MAAMVETMFYVSNEENQRFVPWHGLGTPVEEAPDSETALITAGLDWEVESREIKDTVSGLIIPDYRVNVRTSDNTPLGIVGGRYKLVQNKEAFEFTDALLGEGVKYETAGSLRGGKTIWLLARMDTTKILGDDVTPYMCFTNSHDGSGCIKVCMTPTRVVCNNTLNIALNNAKRMWSTRHTGNINAKLEEAKQTLELSYAYMEELANEAEKLANVTINGEKFEQIERLIFPIDKDKDTDRHIRTMEMARGMFEKAYNASDIKQFNGTGWGIVNAMADYVDHYSLTRNTKNGAENRWGKIMSGHELLDNVYKLVA